MYHRSFTHTHSTFSDLQSVISNRAYKNLIFFLRLTEHFGMCWSVWVERFQTTWLRAMTIHRFIESPPPPYPFVFTLLLFSASCIAKCLITPDFTRTERRQWIASRTMPRQGNITKIVKQHNDRLPGQRREAFIEGVPIFVQNLIAAPARLLLNVGEYRCPHGINFFTPFMNYLTTPFFTS